MRELPEGWSFAAIGDIACNAQQCQPKPDEEFSYIDIGSINRETKKISSPQQLIGDKAPSRARQVVEAGDVLVSMTRPNLNAVALVDQEFSGQIASTGFDVLRPIEIESRWLFYNVCSADFVAAMTELVQGALYPAVRPRDIRNYEIPLPPLNEQKRIADKHDALLARVDRCRERLDRVPLVLKRFRQSVLAAATSGRLTEEWREKNVGCVGAKQGSSASPAFGGNANKGEAGESFASPLQKQGEGEELPEGWSLVISSKLFSFDTSGSRGWAKYYSEKGPLFIRIGNLSHESIALDFTSKQRVNPPECAEGKRTRVKPNDILISITADVGMIALVSEKIEEAYINQHIALARPTEDIYAPFLAWYLSSSEGGLKQFQELKRGATKVGLGLEDIKSIFVPLPPLPEQHEIVRRVETLFAFADRLEARYSAARRRVDQLTPSLLAKAFRGELVPQNPNDEPAEMLLERIRNAQRMA